MSWLETLKRDIAATVARYGNEDLELSDYEQLTGRSAIELAEARRRLIDEKTQLEAAQRVVNEALANELGLNGWVIYGDDQLQYKLGRSPYVIDPAVFFEWVTTLTADEIAALWPKENDAPKILTSGVPENMRDVLLDWRDHDKATIATRPRIKWPKYLIADDPEHGDVGHGRANLTKLERKHSNE